MELLANMRVPAVAGVGAYERRHVQRNVALYVVSVHKD